MIEDRIVSDLPIEAVHDHVFDCHDEIRNLRNLSQRRLNQVHDWENVFDKLQDRIQICLQEIRRLRMELSGQNERSQAWERLFNKLQSLPEYQECDRNKDTGSDMAIRIIELLVNKSKMDPEGKLQELQKKLDECKHCAQYELNKEQDKLSKGVKEATDRISELTAVDESKSALFEANEKRLRDDLRILANKLDQADLLTEELHDKCAGYLQERVLRQEGLKKLSDALDHANVRVEVLSRKNTGYKQELILKIDELKIMSHKLDEANKTILKLSSCDNVAEKNSVTTHPDSEMLDWALTGGAVNRNRYIALRSSDGLTFKHLTTREAIAEEMKKDKQ